MIKYVKNLNNLAYSSDDPNQMRKLYGNKAYNLAKMMYLSIPIPLGFVIDVNACNYYQAYHRLPEGVEQDIKNHIKDLEKQLTRFLGAKSRPLLVSVRSGSSISMPGMMETILNLGLNDETVLGLAEESRSEIFAYDSYARFIRMYAEIVLNIKEDIGYYEKTIHKNLDDLKKIIQEYKDLILEKTGKPFEQDPYKQLIKSIIAVFKSWNLEKAVAYRKINNIPHNLGTSATVLSMVFGNKGDTSGTGVLFTRNPSSGEKKFYGEFIQNAQGEELVAGEKTPQPISFLKNLFPVIYKDLLEIALILERYYRDMQDIEFTIEENRLWILQCRKGKRTGIANTRIILDMFEEDLISKKEAILNLNPEDLEQLLKPIFNSESKKSAVDQGNLMGKGLNASPGNVYGRIVLSSDQINHYSKNKEPIIFVRDETSPEDIVGLSLSVGILTRRGGMTSHAALVARQFGKVAIIGVEELKIDLTKRQIELNHVILNEGDYISLDGNTGEIFKGIIENSPSEIMQVLEYGTLKPEDSIIYKNYRKLMLLIDEIKEMSVYANLDKAEQCDIALKLGAEGIGLCRIEHMFFEPQHNLLIQEMILTESQDRKQYLLQTLFEIQKAEFYAIFTKMKNRPIVLRLLDPPLHEFLPKHKEEIQKLAQQMKISIDELVKMVNEKKETNPMLGNRGCRLGIMDEPITKMQILSIFEAAFELLKKTGSASLVYIMVPFVGEVNEIKIIKKLISDLYRQCEKKYALGFKYYVGTMIEVPRAAITADKIAKEVDFFSFGTNDLTQTTFALSRDDSNKFLFYYLENDILESDPFVKIDEEGVGFLIKLAIQKAKAVSPDISLSVCGEHGGDPTSIRFCYEAKMNYVSCSVFRIPVAKVAVAQAYYLKKSE